MAEKEYLYTTKREMLMRERQALAEALASAYHAQGQLMGGEITSYNLGQWSITRSKVDLDKLAQWISATRLRIDEIDCILSGRAPRKVSTCIYANPQLVRGWL